MFLYWVGGGGGGGGRARVGGYGLLGQLHVHHMDVATEALARAL